jgi:hypothetical protein
MTTPNAMPRNVLGQIILSSLVANRPKTLANNVSALNMERAARKLAT